MQVLKDYKQTSFNVTPLLSERASITMELSQTVRNDYVLAAINPVDGLELRTIENNEVTTIAFVSDRVSLEQIEEFRSNYNDLVQQYNPITSVLARISSTPIVNGKVTGLQAKLRGARVESNIGIEVPYGTAFDKQTVEEAFSFSLDDGRVILNPDVERNDTGEYIVTPQFGKTFRYLDEFTTESYQARAASRLGIPQNDVVYVGVTTTTASNLDVFGDD